MVKVLLDGGADPNIKGGFGWTALMRAAWGGHVEVAKALLNKGADIKSKNDYDKTALDVAETFGKTEVLQILRNAEFKQK